MLEELNLFPATIEEGTKVLFFNNSDEETKQAYSILQQLRSKGIAAEIFHESSKTDKQFKYAEKKNIPYVVREISNDSCVLKNIKTAEQKTMTVEELLNYSF